MSTFVRRIAALLSRRDRQFLGGLLLFSIFISLIETIGVSIIMPFIAVAGDFDLIQTNPYFHTIYTALGFTQPNHFVISFGVALILFYLLRSGINFIYFYLLARFAQGRYHLLAYRLFENYLGLPYREFITRNSGDLTKTITQEARNLTTLISALLFMISEVFVAILIYAMMLYINAKITLLLTVLLLLNAGIVVFGLSKRFKHAGASREVHQKRFFEVITATLGNFKLMKLRGNDKTVLERFKEASYGYAKANISNEALSHAPRLMLEAAGFSLIAFMVVYLVWKYEQDISSALAFLSMFILGLYRLMPSANRIINSYHQILFNYRSLEIIHNDLMYENEPLHVTPIAFKESITLEHVSFAYQSGRPVIKDVSFTIRKGEHIALVGESGSGKSTLADLIMGLYRPQNASILIDGVALCDENIRAWRQKIGYIPQNIYLFEGTIAQNVAFDEMIDEERVRSVLDKAQMLEVLERHHDGIHTRVGEGGINLSGGQRQRIAIARALYPDPEILVLDEATSALDGETEARIMEEIYKICAGKTLIVIAHRLSTIEGCERTIFL
ncbi:MAG: ABC transporter ATP-binding protein [Campylobacterales bacterium]|nr:ABC transporter ATP-binding protein [Campylobacterales bacterium]